MKHYRPIALLLAVMMLLCACGNEIPTDGTTLPTTQETAPATQPTYAEKENPVRYFSLSMGQDYEEIRRMDVFANEDGTVHVEYVGQEKKVGEFDANIMHGITEAFEESGLAALNGKDAYGEGEANASMYVEFADGTMAAVGYSGQIPEEYTRGYEVMDTFFAELTAALPVYVPQPLVMGEVEEPLLSEMMEILTGSGIEALDTFAVSQIAMDEYFAFSAGLSSAEGITAAVSCAPMMMTTAYSLVIVTLEDGKDVAEVCGDFENNLDWRKWVCVAPSNAMLATKGNMVLCMMAYDQVFTGMVTGITQAGWTEVKTLDNPDM